ncbi:MAG: hypothetical protein GY794_07555 [bacterium]|nr:hypothetical protein [bacterium]
MLADMARFAQSPHNPRILIETLALQALLHAVQGDKETALDTVERVLTLAEPGGFIHLFVALGPGMADLLRRCLSRNGPVRYIGKILTAFRGEQLDPEQKASEEQNGQQTTASGAQSLTEDRDQNNFPKSDAHQSMPSPRPSPKGRGSLAPLSFQATLCTQILNKPKSPATP